MLDMAKELDPNYGYISQQWNTHVSQMDPKNSYIPT
jgi:hypothetical protein